MSNDEQRSRDYPVKESMWWQRFEWRVQRFGYLILVLIMIAGACGAFSKGFISNQNASSSDGRLQVRYERFGRLDSTMDISMHLTQLQGKEYQITLQGQQLDDLQIQTLQPQPDEAWSDKNTLILRWHPRSNQQNATVWLTAQPKSYGRFPLTIQLDDRSKVNITSLVYP
ncbi:hypothetical protein O3W44_08720 [Pantoea sp. LMR881]|uniref:hypothetical protein n=1 Tax=Pantoea sp. LMR881 TaxID=3014336 RepID=UPI0022AFCD22|nr:hypothetical protein [Pantoea sp. LMR881]MCZ4059145.1 hypothetical protein [Pantoea sp. LMR881]